MSERFKNGVWPVMLTPFNQDKSIDYEGIEKLTEWYVQCGVDGLFAVCQSSEMFFLNDEEAQEVVRTVKRAAKNRVQVIASGHTAECLEKQVEQIIKIYEAGADAVILITNRLAKENESDEVWRKNAEKLLEKIPENIPLGFYECPYPYKRMISIQNLRWAANTGRFYFLKDTCCDARIIAERMEAVKQTNLKIFNANTATLLATLRNGVAGYSGVMANFHPDLYCWLVKNYQKKEADYLSAFLTVSALIERQVYPLNAKYNLAQNENLKINITCRTRDEKELDETCRSEIQDLYLLTEEMRRTYSGK